MRKPLIAFWMVLLLGLAVPLAQAAASTEKAFTGFGADSVFQAAVKAAGENLRLTNVDRKSMTFVFHVDVASTYGFDWHGRVVKTNDAVRLVLTVPSQPQVLASTSGQRVAERLFEATVQKLMSEEVIYCRAICVPEGRFAGPQASDE